MKQCALGTSLNGSKPDRLCSVLSQYEIQLDSRRQEAREKAHREEEAVRNFLYAGHRERTLQAQM
ncbi:MAG: hypothetical protein ACREIC_27650, partial [Limisphaerales bacterium]